MGLFVLNLQPMGLFMLNCTDDGAIRDVKTLHLNCTDDGAIRDFKTLHLNSTADGAIRDVNRYSPEIVNDDFKLFG